MQLGDSGIEVIPEPNKSAHAIPRGWRLSPCMASTFDEMNELDPSALIPELSDWNNGRGIDLETWVGCMGNIDLAIGYSTIFWPKFVVFEDYVLREGFSIDSLRGFEKQCGDNKWNIECVMNHLHIQDIHDLGDDKLTPEKAEFIGSILKEIYEAKLARDFPDRPCTVKFHRADDHSDLVGYEITFWQTKHQTNVEQ